MMDDDEDSVAYGNIDANAGAVNQCAAPAAEYWELVSHHTYCEDV